MTEIKELLELNYEQCISYLRHKYGGVSKPILSFDNEGNFRMNDFSFIRNEGLFIHNKKEMNIDWLTRADVSRKYPEYDDESNLVYCNLLEHLVLHIKIWQATNRSGGYLFSQLIPELNDIYSGIVYKEEWKNKAASLVRNYKDDYLFCLSKLKVDLKNEVDALLLSSKENEKIGWSKQKNEAFFNEMKEYFKYDKLARWKSPYVNSFVDYETGNRKDDTWKTRIRTKLFLIVFGTIILNAIFWALIVTFLIKK
ncbi:Hypothetical protein, predicted transmembrane protein [Metamycoplasma auris 15026]|uniref:Uncharacterized protein n=1 Tax=Metamycoplasma auris 15026 TaxID=1188233 RepID=N9V9X4_9BACT|nr:hypothetical protein [Metamycoplasma auris]ENY68498.1 Hypothetical protein, predicted transmembrane protein [Metamycoplasma auris 15026]